MHTCMNFQSCIPACFPIRFVTKNFLFLLDSQQWKTEKFVERIENSDATVFAECYSFTVYNFCGLQACMCPLGSITAMWLCLLVHNNECVEQTVLVNIAVSSSYRFYFFVCARLTRRVQQQCHTEEILIGSNSAVRC